MPVLDTRHDLAARRGVAPELVGDDHAQDLLQALRQLAQEPLGRFGIATALHQDIGHVAVLIATMPQAARIVSTSRRLGLKQ